MLTEPVMGHIGVDGQGDGSRAGVLSPLESRAVLFGSVVLEDRTQLAEAMSGTSVLTVCPGRCVLEVQPQAQ